MLAEGGRFVCFDTPADAPSGQTAPVYSDPAAALERILRNLYHLEWRTRKAADMLERSARELPEMADLLNAEISGPVLTGPTRYPDGRAQAGMLRRTPAAAGEA